MPPWMYGVGWLAGLPLLFGPNTGLAFMGMVVATLLVKLLWRPGEAPTLVWIGIWQWFQAFVGIFQATVAGVSVEAYFGGEEFASATQLSFLGVLCLAVGIRWSVQLLDASATPVLPHEFASLKPQRLFLAWLVLSFSAEAVNRVLWGTGLASAVQPILYFHLAAMLLLFQRAFATGEGRGLAAILLCTETIVGFVGYFAGFKTVFFFVILAALSFVWQRQRLWIVSAVSLLVVVLMGSFWQGFKNDYRAFVNEGENAQIITVSVGERLRFLSEALESAGPATLLDGLDAVLTRIGYVTYFGHCIRTVPQGVPHANGRLWKEAVMHVFMPRILFPNKMEFNDSDRTNEFCDIQVADASQGTSIGIGYIGESYVDFGVPGMFFPILAFGVFIGAAYGLLVRLAPNRIFGAALATTLVMRSTIDLASSNAKMLGALMASLLIYLVVIWLAGKAIWRWLSGAGGGGETAGNS